jgi:hypothetical protein
MSETEKKDTTTTEHKETEKKPDPITTPAHPVRTPDQREQQKQQ